MNIAQIGLIDSTLTESVAVADPGFLRREEGRANPKGGFQPIVLAKFSLTLLAIIAKYIFSISEWAYLYQALWRCLWTK